MIWIKSCEYCGKEWETSDYRIFKTKKYCSLGCRMEVQKLYEDRRHRDELKVRKEAKRKHEEKHKTLVEMNRNAKDLGLSYGEYVALTETDYNFKFKERDKDASECEV